MYLKGKSLAAVAVLLPHLADREGGSLVADL